MTEEKKDLRYVRTRKSIQDAFIELSGKKDFKDITIKDITTEAMINRATFYYHFIDKYDLLDKVLSEVFLFNLDSTLFKKNDLNEEVIVNIFTAVTTFHRSLSYRCFNGYEETIARIVKDHLENIFYRMIRKQESSEEKSTIAASILSWGIYGAAEGWCKKSKESPEEYIKLAMPYLEGGFYFKTDKKD